MSVESQIRSFFAGATAIENQAKSLALSARQILEEIERLQSKKGGKAEPKAPETAEASPAPAKEPKAAKAEEAPTTKVMAGFTVTLGAKMVLPNKAELSAKAAQLGVPAEKILEFFPVDKAKPANETKLKFLELLDSLPDVPSNGTAATAAPAAKAPKAPKAPKEPKAAKEPKAEATTAATVVLAGFTLSPLGTKAGKPMPSADDIKAKARALGMPEAEVKALFSGGQGKPSNETKFKILERVDGYAKQTASAAN